MELVCRDSEFHLPECSDPREGRTDALVFEVYSSIVTCSVIALCRTGERVLTLFSIGDSPLVPTTTIRPYFVSPVVTNHFVFTRVVVGSSPRKNKIGKSSARPVYDIELDNITTTPVSVGIIWRN